jgi:hypothetical protein
MPNLIPTAIVDKNGRQTTVHKAAIAAPSKALKVPAPSVSKTAAKPRKTIHDVPPMSKFEADLFLSNGGIMLPSWIFANRDKITAHKNGMDTVALTRYFLRSGKLDGRVLTSIIFNGGDLIFTDSANVYNSMLMVEYLSREGKRELLDENEAVLGAVRGLPVNNSAKREPLPQFETEDQLAEYAAVVEYIVRQKDASNTVSDARLFVEGKKVQHPTAIANKHLEKLIRENTNELDAIITYVNERGMDKKKSSVDTLREWLDSEVPSILRGGTL